MCALSLSLHQYLHDIIGPSNIRKGCPDKLCCCLPLEIFQTRVDKVLTTCSVLIVDHTLSSRWTRCFPEVCSKLNFPVILQMRVTKTRGLTSEFFLLPLPMFQEDKAFPSSKLIDYFEASSVGNLYIFFCWRLMRTIIC